MKKEQVTKDTKIGTHDSFIYSYAETQIQRSRDKCFLVINQSNKLCCSSYEMVK